MSATAFQRRRREQAKMIEEARKAKDPAKPLNKMNKAELLAIAKEKGLNISDQITNKDIIRMIEEAG